MQTIEQIDRFTGCLLAGAVGDALGAPVEFMRREDIIAQYDVDGIQQYAAAYGRVGAITDDTQMMLFTGEGLLRAVVRAESKGMCSAEATVCHAYQRWLKTQGETSPAMEQLEPQFGDGWLMTIPALFSRRAPGNTCISSLKSVQSLGDYTATNDSKGCGGVMRVAPVALLSWDRKEPLDFSRSFRLAGDMAKITHGHPSSTFSSSALAALIYLLLSGQSLKDALQLVKAELRLYSFHEETLQALEKAEHLAWSKIAIHEAISQLGEGWVAEEALAIGVYSVLVSSSLKDALIIAVNHSGDSDSTGSIAGNLAGALYGVSAIPKEWLETLEFKDVIEELAVDLYQHHNWRLSMYESPDDVTKRALEKYPGW